jgi:hypothetical protein
MLCRTLSTKKMLGIDLGRQLVTDAYSSIFSIDHVKLLTTTFVSSNITLRDKGLKCNEFPTLPYIPNNNGQQTIGQTFQKNAKPKHRNCKANSREIRVNFYQRKGNNQKTLLHPLIF